MRLDVNARNCRQLHEQRLLLDDLLEFSLGPYSSVRRYVFRTYYGPLGNLFSIEQESTGNFGYLHPVVPQSKMAHRLGLGTGSQSRMCVPFI